MKSSQFNIESMVTDTLMGFTPILAKKKIKGATHKNGDFDDARKQIDNII